MTDRIFWHLLGVASDCAEGLMFEGSNPWELDEALVASGFRMGVCELQDLYGIDTIQAQKPMPNEPLPIVSRMLQEGRFGKKYGVGWYRYPGGGGCVIDPLVEDLIREEAHFANIARREISDGEIVHQINQSLRTAICNLRQDGVEKPRIFRVLRDDLGISEV